MAIAPIPTTVLFFFLLFQPSLLSADSLVADLSALQSKSPTGVIHLTDSLLRRILSLPTPRHFYCIVFFDARKLHSNPEIGLPILKSEFSILSSSFRTNNPNNKTSLFFFDIELQESQTSFALFQVQSLPHICLIPPSATDLKSDSISMDASDFSNLAKSMAEFIASKTGITIGPINRLPFFSNKQFLLTVAALLIWAAVFIKKLLTRDSIFHDKSVWMGGVIVIYFFCVSGAMFTIIKKTPLFFLDRQNPQKMMFFYPGSGFQLGAEGFAVGFLYTVVGILLAFTTHMVVRIRDRRKQRIIMVCFLIAMLWAVRKVILLASWKTKYRVRGYWPSRWR